MRAVLHVIANNAKASKIEWDDFIERKNEFSSISHAGDPMLIAYPNIGKDAIYDFLLDIVEKVWSETDIDNTGGALYYANLDTMDHDGWFARNIVLNPLHPQTAKIGKHTFFA